MSPVGAILTSQVKHSAILPLLTPMPKKPLPKKKDASIPSKLSEGEQDLLSHLEHGYELQTDTLGRNPVLRHLKNNEVVRPASANRNTIKGLEDRGLITPSEGREPLTLAWRLKKGTK